MSLHVFPVGDLMEHLWRENCWCHPTRSLDDSSVIIHNSLDGRETSELLEEVLGHEGH